MAKTQVKPNEEKKGGLGRYFRGVKSEFKKVVWPTFDKVVQYSLIVIAVTIAISLLLVIYDKLVMFLLSPIY